jgi:NAD(P)-dependent dehydrogenase (short-subunit alcohol dehydrogenase family)
VGNNAGVSIYGRFLDVSSVDNATTLRNEFLDSASKHAVKGLTDALRMELEDEHAPTLIKPGPIDTPYPEHAKNYLEDQPKHAPPVYATESVAEAILHAATTPVRDLFVGGGAKFVANRVAARMRYTRLAAVCAKKASTPASYARASIHERPCTRSGAAAVGAGLLVAALWRGNGEQMYSRSTWGD